MNVEDSARVVVGLPEGDVAKKALHDTTKIVNVEGAATSSEIECHASWPLNLIEALEDGEVPFAELFQLCTDLVGFLCAQNGAYDAAGRGAADNARQEILLEKTLDNTCRI
jgi:hypothetical protein